MKLITSDIIHAKKCVDTDVNSEFEFQTYTGNSSTEQTISDNLSVVPFTIVVPFNDTELTAPIFISPKDKN